MGVNKVQYGNQTIIDITDTTATTSDVVSGKYFYGKDGVKALGTAVLNNVTQDQDGFIVLPPTGGGSPSVSGLVYESGTWTPSEDVSTAVWISFANTHTVAPFYYLISDATGTYSSVVDSTYLVQYTNFHQLYGEPHYIDTGNSNIGYGLVNFRYRSTASAFNSGTVSINTSYTDSADGSNGCSRYWATETGIRAYSNNTSRYFRAGRTYKWIAVWAPTT